VKKIIELCCASKKYLTRDVKPDIHLANEQQTRIHYYIIRQIYAEANANKTFNSRLARFSWGSTSNTIRVRCGRACAIRCCSLSKPSYPRLS